MTHTLLKITLSALVAIIAIPSFAKELTSVEKLGLAGRVKSYTIYSAKETYEGLVNEYKTEEYLFDEHGNMTSHVVYTPHGHIIRSEKSDINEKGKIIKEKTLDKNGNESVKKENIFNKKGLLVKTVTTDSKGETVAIDSFIYQGKKRIGKTRWQANPYATMTYTYDKRGDITSRIIENGEQCLKEYYSYNKQHDIALLTKYETRKTSSGSFKTDTTQTYWLYDAQNHLKSKTVSIGGYIRELYHYTCDIKGNKTNVYHYVFDDKINLFINQPLQGIDLDKLLKDSQKFTYDSNGNKTSERVFDYKSKTDRATVFEITYYSAHDTHKKDSSTENSETEVEFCWYYYDFKHRDMGQPDEIRVQIEEIIEFINSYPDAKFEISCYTDIRGNEAYNKKLSQKRAEVFRETLISWGADGNRLTAIGRGKERPIIENAQTEEEHMQNRRAEIRFQK